MKTILFFLLSSLLILSVPSSLAGPNAQGLIAYYDGSYYQVVNQSGIDWDSATAQASTATFGDCQSSHLVTITSAAEQHALDYYLGANLDSKWFGGIQDDGETVPTAGWHWVTGEPWEYTNWCPDEPNDAWGSASEQRLVGWPVQCWNDGETTSAEGYVIEYEGCSQTAMIYQLFLPMTRRFVVGK